ncbi:MAG: hypothetical protein VX000_12865, partial [Myxococcota bacterium]|nr:hypothetical protein [Myxococcota bacterium]
MRVEDGRLSPQELLPALIVSAEPRYAASEAWYATRAIEVLQSTLGNDGLRLCEACMAPRTVVEEGRLTFQTGPVSTQEVLRLDAAARGDAPAAKTAIWLDEHRGGVSIRIVDLASSRVLFAQNVDPDLVETA